MGSAKKAVKSFVSAPVNIVKSAVKGDVMGVANAATNAVSYGGVSLTDNSGGFIDASNLVGEITGANALKDAVADQTAAANALIEEQKNAAATAAEKANASRRAYSASQSRTYYTTALGDVSDTAAATKRKRTLLGS
jgi:hypothetical protein